MACPPSLPPSQPQDTQAADKAFGDTPDPLSTNPQIQDTGEDTEYRTTATADHLHTMTTRYGLHHTKKLPPANRTRRSNRNSHSREFGNGTSATRERKKKKECVF
jgi:hypothetical protein